MGGSRRGLSGVGVVITRPAAQAGRLASLVRSAGGIPIEFPCIAIKPLRDSASLADVLADLPGFHIAIFISPNAVSHALDAISAAGSAWPQRLQVAVVGPGSRRALEERGFHGVITPARRYDSEGLLDEPTLRDVKGKRIVIFRGRGGREMLAVELRKRGAEVIHAECYERTVPQTDAAPLLARWREGEVGAIVFTSSQAVRNFVGLAGGRLEPPVTATPAFVTHERIAAAAADAGFSFVVGARAGDEGIVSALTEHFV